MESTASWYYADLARQRHGPMTRDALAAAFDRGLVDDATLVWRSGLAAWQPLASVADELGLRGRRRVSVAMPDLPSHPAFAPPVDARDVVYAGFLKRWAALIIDSLVLMVPVFVLSLVLGFIAAVQGGAHAWAQWIGYAAWLVLAPFYFAGLESSRWQATLGKQVIGIKVTDLQGRRIGVERAVGRWFAAALSYLTFYVGFFMAGFTARKQALHDFAAGTLVVDRWAFTEQPERQRPALGPAGIVVLVVVPVIGLAIAGILAAIALPAYQDYTLRAKVAEAMVQGSAAKTAVAEAVAETGRCPANGENGLDAPTGYASHVVASITASTGTAGRCTLDIRLRAPGIRAIDGHTIGFDMDRETQHWTCRTDLAARLVPASCAAEANAASSSIAR